jgi:hypothetical protein
VLDRQRIHITWLVFDVDGPTWKWLALYFEVATTALDGHATELLELRLAGDGGEPIAYFAGDDLPAILLIFIKGLAELIELSKQRVSKLFLFPPT